MADLFCALLFNNVKLSRLLCIGFCLSGGWLSLSLSLVLRMKPGLCICKYSPTRLCPQSHCILINPQCFIIPLCDRIKESLINSAVDSPINSTTAFCGVLTFFCYFLHYCYTISAPPSLSPPMHQPSLPFKFLVPFSLVVVTWLPAAILNWVLS